MNNDFYDLKPNTDFSDRQDVSAYEIISAINETRHIYLVKHNPSGMICVRKDLAIYNISIYKYLKDNPIPGIPKIFAIKETDGILSIIEEYISGETLAEHLERHSTISEKECRNIILSICDILNTLHNSNPPIVHRDIKPSNIMITTDGRVMLLDFNAAKHPDNTQSSDTTLLGTQGYAAPEQYGFGSSTPKTDIYAIGMLLKRIIECNPHLAASFSRIADRCTRLDPSDRYQSIYSLQTAISINNSFLPPGFRRKKIWHMIIAIPVYIMIFWLSLTIEYNDLPPTALPIERFFTLVWLLGLVGISCNYVNIWRHLPLCSSRYPLLRLLGVILWDTVYTMITIIIIVIIDITVFNYHG